MIKIVGVGAPRREAPAGSLGLVEYGHIGMCVQDVCRRKT